MNSQPIDDYIEDEIDLQYYWMLLLTVLYKYYKYLIVFVILSSGAVYYYIQTAIPTYTASLTLHLADRDHQSWDDYYGGSYSPRTVFQTTQIDILRIVMMPQVLQCTQFCELIWNFFEPSSSSRISYTAAGQ